MQIAVIGGTGAFGRGLTLRWGVRTDHELVVGSRDPQKARASAEDYREVIAGRNGTASVSGASNADAVAGADVVVLSVPPEYLSETIAEIADSLSAGTTVVSPAVPMTRDAEGFHYDSPETADSVTALVAREAPDDVAVTGAFHNVAAERLADLDYDLDLDIVVVADDADAVDAVVTLAEEIEGVRGLHGGGLSSATDVERITPLLINIRLNNGGMDHLAVRFT